MKRTFILLLISCLFVSSGKAQTGPGGVGSTTACGSLKLWLDADAGVSTTGAAVTLWSDRSASCADDATPPAAANRPQLVNSVINGFPTIRFDGTDDYFDISNESNLDMTQWSIFIVGKINTNKDYNYWFGKGNDGSENFEFLCYAAPFIHTPILYTDGSRDFMNSNNPTNAVNSYNIWQYDRSSGGVRTIYGDGTSIATATTAKTPQTNNFTAWLGTERGITGRYFNGDMSEVIVFNSLANQAQRTIIENYLSAKYDIALSTASDDKYAGDDNANGDYDFGVAGIGQSAAGATNTSFSSSIAGGMGITYSSGFNNGDYIMAGYALPYNFEDVVDIGGLPGGQPARWVRDFYIDVTNTGTNMLVNFTFDMSDGGVGSGVSLGNANKYDLVYRAGTSGNWTVIQNGASSVSGDQVIFNGITITNDGYYTISTENKNSASLPVDLLSFNAVPNDQTVDITWSTATEQNNDHFTVERSGDGLVFKPAFKINTKANGGNSLIKLDYAGKDADPLDGVSYYRLVQTDRNSASKTYNMVAVNFVKDKNILFTVCPNPNKGEFVINFKGLENDHTVDIFLHDVQGKEVYHDTFSTQTSGGSFNIIPLQKISAGVYTCTLYFEEIKHQLKIVVE